MDSRLEIGHTVSSRRETEWVGDRRRRSDGGGSGSDED